MKQEILLIGSVISLIRQMGLELSNGRVLQTFKLWIKLWGVLLRPFKFLLAPMLTFALLTWVYSGLYDKFGFERVVQSAIVIFIIIGYKVIYYLKKISETKNGNN